MVLIIYHYSYIISSKTIPFARNIFMYGLYLQMFHNITLCVTFIVFGLFVKLMMYEKVVSDIL
jgi:hypothetical protein